MSSGKLLLGVLGGVAAGALLGMLFAPEKGSRTRRKVSKKGEHYVEGLKEKFDEFLHSMAEKFEEVKEEYADYIEENKAAREKPVKDVHPA